MPSPKARRTAAEKEDEELGSPMLTASINGPVAATDAKLLKEIRGRQLTFDLPELGECALTGHGVVVGASVTCAALFITLLSQAADERPAERRTPSLTRHSCPHKTQHA